jgi:hypothetical protein
MTIAQHLRNAGRQEGRREIAYRLLAEFKDSQKVAELTGLSLEEIHHLMD